MLGARGADKAAPLGHISLRQVMIKPTNPGQPGAAGATPLKGHTPVPPRADQAPVRRPTEPVDEVQVSRAARELQQRIAEEAPPSGTLDPERLRELARRIGEGHYLHADVQDEVLRRALDYLERQGGEG